MTDCTLCNICTEPGQFENSSEVNQIFSNVRKFRMEKFTVWRCNSCGSLHSKEGIDLNHYYSDYFIKRHKLDLWARFAYNNRLRHLIREGLQPHHKILDYGCGQGLFVTFLHQKGYKNAAGYDPYMPKYSDKKLLNQLYDVVLSQDVIEHAEEPRAFMEQLINYIRKDGLLYIGTPMADNINLSRPAEFASPLHQPYHRHIFSKNALIQLGKDLGLSVGTIYPRWYYDTLFPTVNTRFIYSYVYESGNCIDVTFEPPKVKLVLLSPRLLFYAFWGYFFPPSTDMAIAFHKKHLQY